MTAPAAGLIQLADSDTGKGSPIGFFVVLVLVIAVYFLYRSLSRHLGRVPESFDQPPASAGQAAGDSPVADPSADAASVGDSPVGDPPAERPVAPTATRDSAPPSP